MIYDLVYRVETLCIKILSLSKLYPSPSALYTYDEPCIYMLIICACGLGLFPIQSRGGAAAPCWFFVGLQTQKDVLRLDVSVDDFALSVKVVQALQDLERTQNSYPDVFFQVTSTYDSIRVNWCLKHIRMTDNTN